MHNTFPIHKGTAHFLSPHAFCPFLINLAPEFVFIGFSLPRSLSQPLKSQHPDVCMPLSWPVSVPGKTTPMIPLLLPLSLVAGEKSQRLTRSLSSLGSAGSSDNCSRPLTAHSWLLVQTLSTRPRLNPTLALPFDRSSCNVPSLPVSLIFPPSLSLFLQDRKVFRPLI